MIVKPDRPSNLCQLVLPTRIFWLKFELRIPLKFNEYLLVYSEQSQWLLENNFITSFPIKRTPIQVEKRSDFGGKSSGRFGEFTEFQFLHIQSKVYGIFKKFVATVRHSNIRQSERHMCEIGKNFRYLNFQSLLTFPLVCFLRTFTSQFCQFVNVARRSSVGHLRIDRNSFDIFN